MKESMVVKLRCYHMKNKPPDRLYCRKNDKEIYDHLKKEEIFKGLDHIHIFMIAMSMGYKAKRRVPLVDTNETKEGLTLLYHIPENYNNLMTALAIAEVGDLNVMLDKGAIYTIAEEYATGGIRLLKNKVMSGEFGSYPKHLEAELIELCDEVK